MGQVSSFFHRHVVADDGGDADDVAVRGPLAAIDETDARPGMVSAIQTFGQRSQSHHLSLLRVPG